MGLLKTHLPENVSNVLAYKKMFEFNATVPLSRCGALSFHENTGNINNINTARIMIGMLNEELRMNIVLNQEVTGITTHYERPINRTPFSVISITDPEPSGVLKHRSTETVGLLLPDEAEMVVWTIAKAISSVGR
jgi:hypothetical protein